MYCFTLLYIALICFAFIALDQHQLPVVYFNKLLSSYSIFQNKDNLANNQLYNNLLDQL